MLFVIRFSQLTMLRCAKRVIFSPIHRTVSDRLRQFNDIESEVLYPPLQDPERFRSDGYGDEIVCVSRIEHHKRQHLLIEALSHTKTPVKLRLCGVSQFQQCTKATSKH